MSATGRRADESGADAVLGNVAHAGVGEAPRRSVRDRLSGHDDVPVVDATQTGEHLGELGLSVARHAGDAEDLARVERSGSRRAARARPRQLRTPRHPAAPCTASLADVSRCSTDSSRSSPVINVANSRAVTPEAARVTTCSPWRSTVIRSPTSSTSFSLWEMNTTVRPVATRSRITPNSSPASAVVSTAVGSSRISVRVPRASIRRISTRCCSPTESCQTFASRIDPQPELVHQAVGACDQLAAGDARRGRVPAEVDVLRDGHRRHEAEVLVHHPDAGVDGLGGGVELVCRAVDLDVAGVGAVDAGEDVAQRRLPGAVLAEQGVDFAATQLEVDVAQRPRPRRNSSRRGGPRRPGRRPERRPDVDLSRLRRRRGQPSTPDTPSTAQSIR